MKLNKKQIEALDESRKVIGVECYIPLGQSYLDIHLSQARERWDFSGNRKGKTAQFVVEDVWHATGAYPDKHNLIFPFDYPQVGRSRIPSRGRIVATNLNDGIVKCIIPELQKWIPRKYLLKGSWQESYDARHRVVRLKTVKNINDANPDPQDLSTIDLFSADQDPQSFAGTARDWVHLDEHVSRIIYQENKMRLISTRGRLWSSMTPIDESGQPALSWEFDDIFEEWEKNKHDPAFHKKMEVFRGSTMDNPLNSKDIVDDMVRGLDEDTKRVRLFGDFIALSGLIYKEFRDRLYTKVMTEEDFYQNSGHLVEPFRIPDSWPRFCAIDPHPRKPIYTLWVAADPYDNHYYYDELNPSVEGILLKTYFDLIKLKEEETGSKNRMRYRLIDTSAKEPDPILGTTIKDEFDKLFRAYDGVTTREANKNVNAGIQQIHKGLRPSQQLDGTWRPRIYLFKNLIETRYQMRHYVWGEFTRRQELHDPKQKPRKKRDDYLDCMRYMEISGLKYDPPKIHSLWSGNPYTTQRW